MAKHQSFNARRTGRIDTKPEPHPGGSHWDIHFMVTIGRFYNMANALFLIIKEKHCYLDVQPRSHIEKQLNFAEKTKGRGRRLLPGVKVFMFAVRKKRLKLEIITDDVKIDAPVC